MTASVPLGSDATSKVFEIANPAADPEGIITKYVAFESARLVRDAHEFDMVGSLQDRLKVLIWYLIDYGNHRQNKFAVPLSARQTAYLNSPLPAAGVSPAVTVALFNFVLREKPSLINLRDPGVLVEAVYWWCVEKAPLHKLDSRLITNEQVYLLRKEVQWIGEEFPLNHFMISFFNKRVDLHFLHLAYPQDRAAFFHYLVLYGFLHPQIVRFLPPESVRKVLREAPGEASAFDRNVARYILGDKGDPLAGARKVHALGADLLAQADLSVYRGANDKVFDSGECCMAARHPSDSGVEDGVAIFGPILKTSGLGQATRLSHEIFKSCETIKPTVLDFDLDNPAPVGFASNLEFAPFCSPRAINLIHLNAESVPLAFAFKPRSFFAQSYNIGYFFWELNMIPKCHRLALELLDEIWVSSEYNREIYARFTDKPVIKVGMAVEPLPDVAPMNRMSIGLEDDAFVFLSTFDSFSFIERKNPLGVLDAFRKAFPLGNENVQLVLKTQNRFRVGDPHQVQMWQRIDAAVGADSRISVINETYKYRDLLALKRTCDCYVSLHRSEGWGFGMIEAMQLGLPVIATGYSGNMEFSNADTAYLVGYNMVGVREAEYIFVERGSMWADPNLDEAAAHMRSAVADPGSAKAKGLAASSFIANHFCETAIGKRYAARLAEIRHSKISSE